ncbi:hypothetical protein FBU30_007282 [Linnemannia zychae]|nr:hypothetical protein FBU30_007282 [Linnemannia zychae]
MLKKTYINPNDIIRTKDGKIDLFETIMARKDPTAQIPIVPTSSAQTSTSSIPTETTSRPLKRTTLYSPISTSDAWKVTRVSSEQVASTKTDSLASRPNDYTIPCASINTPTTNTTPSSGAPVIAQTSPQGKASWSNAFDDYCSDPNSIPADLRQWHDNNYLVIKDAYPKTAASTYYLAGLLLAMFEKDCSLELV